MSPRCFLFCFQISPLDDSASGVRPSRQIKRPNWLDEFDTASVQRKRRRTAHSSSPTAGDRWEIFLGKIDQLENCDFCQKKNDEDENRISRIDTWKRYNIDLKRYFKELVSRNLIKCANFAVFFGRHWSKPCGKSVPAGSLIRPTPPTTKPLPMRVRGG